jgi:hypothetical protein
LSGLGSNASFTLIVGPATSSAWRFSFAISLRSSAICIRLVLAIRRPLRLGVVHKLDTLGHVATREISTQRLDKRDELGLLRRDGREF